MLATSYHGRGRIEVVQKPEPKIEHPNDVILKVTRTAICGSDLHLFHGLVPDTRSGCCFGHEFAGIVEDVGSSVASLQKGDRVVVPFNIACGSCYFCKRGLTGCCENANPCSNAGVGNNGRSARGGAYAGGQAERVRVPFADIGPMKIPDDMHEEDVLFLNDSLPTGYQAAEMGNVKPGDTVVVFGCGPVGLFAQKCALLRGAGRVIAVDEIPYRLELAQRFSPGIEVLHLSETSDTVADIRKLTDGRGADVCIDCVGCEVKGSLIHSVLGRLMLEAGSAVAIQWSIDSVRNGGTVVLVGVYGPPFTLINVAAAMSKGLTLRIAKCNAKRHTSQLLEHIRAGRIDPKGIISHRVPLEHADYAYHIFDRKLEQCVKCVLIPPLAA